MGFKIKPGFTDTSSATNQQAKLSGNYTDSVYSDGGKARSGFYYIDKGDGKGKIKVDYVRTHNPDGSISTKFYDISGNEVNNNSFLLDTKETVGYLGEGFKESVPNMVGNYDQQGNWSFSPKKLHIQPEPVL